VAWGAFLLAAAGDPRAEDPVCAAELAYRSEVTEFGAPGGMMDHYSSALGGVIWLDCLNPITCRRLPGPVGPFLLIDSGEPKNTNSVLARVRGAVEGALQHLPPSVPGGITSRLEDLDLASSMNGLTPEQRQILCGTLANRDITTDACRLLLTADCDLPQLGRLLDAHQYQLAERLGVSTPRIDGILALARKAGALGGKINGSGGGGTCFVLCGDNLPTIQQVIDAAGFRAWGVTTGAGLRVRQEHP
jgi:galactokinase